MRKKTKLYVKNWVFTYLFPCSVEQFAYSMCIYDCFYQRFCIMRQWIAWLSFFFKSWMVLCVQTIKSNNFFFFLIEKGKSARKSVTYVWTSITEQCSDAEENHNNGIALWWSAWTCLVVQHAYIRLDLMFGVVHYAKCAHALALLYLVLFAY